MREIVAPIGLAALALIWGGPAVALDCRRPNAAIEVTFQTSEPTIDNTLPQPELQRISRGPHYGSRPPGLYRGELSARENLRLAWRSEGDEVCVRVDRVRIEVTLRERKIWVIRERKPGTCEYDAVLGHERKHQAVDDSMLQEAGERLRQAVAAAIDALPARAIPSFERPAAEAHAAETVAAAFRATMGEILRDRDARQLGVDTPQEYRRIGAACDPMRDRK